MAESSPLKLRVGKVGLATIAERRWHILDDSTHCMARCSETLNYSSIQVVEDRAVFEAMNVCRNCKRWLP